MPLFNLLPSTFMVLFTMLRVCLEWDGSVRSKDWKEAGDIPQPARINSGKPRKVSPTNAEVRNDHLRIQIQNVPSKPPSLIPS
jgi:hypothetical protein